MKKVLSFILVIAMVTSLLVCCVPAASAEEAPLAAANGITIITKNPTDAVIARPGTVSFEVETAFDFFENIEDAQTVDIISAVLNLFAGNLPAVPGGGVAENEGELAALLESMGQSLTPDAIAELVAFFTDLNKYGIAIDNPTLNTGLQMAIGYFGSLVGVNPTIIGAIVVVVAALKGVDIAPDDGDVPHIIISLVLGLEKFGGLVSFAEKAVDLLGKLNLKKTITTEVAKFIFFPKFQWYINGEKVSKAYGDLTCTGATKNVFNVKLDKVPAKDTVYTVSCTVSLLSYDFLSSDAKLTVIGSDTMPFSDIKDNFFCDQIKEAYYKGIVKGFNDGTYKPTQEVTRAQFIAMLWRAVGEPGTTLQYTDLWFSDAASIHSGYFKAIAWGLEQGIISGYADNTFRPNQKISRAQMATFIFRYMDKVELYDFGDMFLTTHSFADDSLINIAYLKAVYEIVSVGIMSGFQDNTFRPQGTANRGQAASVLLRMNNLLDPNMVG